MTASVFELWPADGFRRFGADSEIMARYERMLRINGEPKGDTWSAPPIEVWLDADCPQANVTPIGMGLSRLVFDSRAKAVIAPIVGGAVEWLPIVTGSQQHWLLNPLVVVDCLNHKETETMPNLPTAILTYVFEESLLPDAAVFRIPEGRNASTFTHVRQNAPNSQFKTVYEQNKLTGLRFKEVWHSPS